MPRDILTNRHITRRTFIKAAAASTFIPLCSCAPASGINVVCVLVDQLRKDAVDLWADRITRLAERGIVFEQMRSVAPWTYPAVISMLSGLYPQQHGADGALNSDVLSTFDGEVPLLHKMLRASGYRTAGFVTNPFFHTWNTFHEGFDSYDIHFINSVGNRRGFERLVWVPERMFANYVNSSVVKHFDRESYRRPEFTYIHYIDVHGPWKGAPFSGNYRASVEYIDERLVEMYEYFMHRYDGNLLFFVTSDHGQALGDDERVGYGQPWRKNKGSVHDFNLRIPFIILPSDLVSTARRISEPCSNADFAPTVLDWLGISQEYRTPGVSLMPIIGGGTLSGETRALYSKVSAFGRLSDCVVFRNRKYVRFFDVDTRQVVSTRVFDLVGDPREEVSLDGEFEDRIGLLQEAERTHGLAYAAHYDDISPQAKARLQALGYLE